MATHQSAVKRHRQSLKKKARNKTRKSVIKNVIKEIRASEDKTSAQEKIKKASSVLDKMAEKGIIHKNKAANQKSKLTKIVNKIPAKKAE